MSRSTYQNYAQSVSLPISTPQSRPIPGREAEMVANNAGGFGFTLDKWNALHRFLIIGSEGGTYYIREHKLTELNAKIAIECIKEDGNRAALAAYHVNTENLAPKVNSQLFVMALVLKHGDDTAKGTAEALLPSMLRTGTHLLNFAAMVDGLCGWGRSKRRIFSNWFESRDPDALAYQVLKYRNRDGWTIRDVMRLCHPVSAPYQDTDPVNIHKRVAVYNWICGRKGDFLPRVLNDYELIQIGLQEGNLTPLKAALLGVQLGLPREALPTEALNDPELWKAMLPSTPLHALLRNLVNLEKYGVFNHAPSCGEAVRKLRNANSMRTARVHPFAVLLASMMCKQNRVARPIMEALDDAYDAAFDNVGPTNKRILVGIDISGSMGKPCMGTPIPTNLAAAAMALTIARLEPYADVVQFDTRVQKQLAITKRSSVSSLESTHGGGTDVASPVIWAAEHNYPYDAFIILTDDETWAGKMHPQQAIESYRRQTGLPTKLICCSMAANNVSVVDPKDPLSLGVCGLDASIPGVIAGFISD